MEGGNNLKLTVGRIQTSEVDHDSKQCIVTYFFKSGYNMDDSSASLKRTGLSLGDLITQVETAKFLACEGYVSEDSEDSAIPNACTKYKTDNYILFRKGGKGHASGDGGQTKTPIKWNKDENNQACISVILGDKEGGFCIQKDPRYLDGRGNPSWGLFKAYIADPSWQDE